jgi:N-acetylglutamate synthase-like GNAT family acetyltransferase
VFAFFTLHFQAARFFSFAMSMQPQVRRATIDDLPKLVPLWRAEGLPADDLEKRFKEFQVLEGPGGQVLGGVGLQISGQEGRLHSEAFAHPEHADELRPKLWERVRLISNNHGLVRLWTQLESPFWHQTGFNAASTELIARLPSAFVGDPHRSWTFYQLRGEGAATVSLDKEFAMFREAERERTEKIFRQARVLKLIAALLAVAVLGLVIFWAVMFFNLQRKRR